MDFIISKKENWTSPIWKLDLFYSKSKIGSHLLQKKGLICQIQSQKVDPFNTRKDRSVFLQERVQVSSTVKVRSGLFNHKIMIRSDLPEKRYQVLVHDEKEILKSASQSDI